MKQWTGFVAVVLSSLALMACGVAEDLDAQELAGQEAGLEVCGNGVCFASELGTCPADCNYGGYCGDSLCNGPENQTTCPQDCRVGCVAPE